MLIGCTCQKKNKAEIQITTAEAAAAAAIKYLWSQIKLHLMSCALIKRLHRFWPIFMPFFYDEIPKRCEFRIFWMFAFQYISTIPSKKDKKKSSISFCLTCNTWFVPQLNLFRLNSKMKGSIEFHFVQKASKYFLRIIDYILHLCSFRFIFMPQ